MRIGLPIVLLFLILYSKTEPVGFDRGPFYFEVKLDG
jgi:hypothetical protein